MHSAHAPRPPKIKFNKGGKSASLTRFSLIVENEQADAGQYGRTSLARSNSQARTWTEK